MYDQVKKSPRAYNIANSVTQIFTILENEMNDDDNNISGNFFPFHSNLQG